MTKTPPDQFPARQRTEEGEEAGEEDADGRNTENVDQHVWVAVPPEDSTQHLCRFHTWGGKKAWWGQGKTKHKAWGTEWNAYLVQM